MPNTTIMRTGHVVKIKGQPLTFVITHINDRDMATLLHIGSNNVRIEEKLPCCCLRLIDV